MSYWLRRGFAPFNKYLPTSISQPIRSVVTAIVTPIRFSVVTGHFSSSFKRAATGRSGQPLPWYTYPAIDFLSQRNFKDASILEFGGGQSTLWWSSRSRSVTTIEENLEWYSRLRSQIAQNVSLHHVPADMGARDIGNVRTVLYSEKIKKFDIVIIDGHLRSELVPLAFEVLAENGVIIFDNSDGYGCYEALNKFDCSRIDFYGFAPGVSMRHCTSVAFKGKPLLLNSDIKIVSGECV